MPSRTRSSVARPLMRCPAKRISPAVRTMPHTARSVVVLPAPLAPRIDDAARGVRHGPHGGRDPLRGAAHQRARDGRPGATRHRPRARGARHVREPHRRGEPAPGRLRAARGRQCRAGPRARVRLLPRARRAQEAGGRHALRRRAADAGRRARAHAAATAAPARRAGAGAGAAGRARDPPHRAHHQPGGARECAARRAERRGGAGPRRPRVPHGDRPRRDVRAGQRAAAERRHPPRLSRLLTMEIFFQQVVSGLATGGIYGSVALALVMIYQATDVVNYAQGEMAMFSTYIAWTLINAGVPYWWAFFATLVISFVGGVLLERGGIRPVES